MMTPDQLDAFIEYIQAERVYSEHLAKHGSASVNKRDEAETKLREAFRPEIITHTFYAGPPR